MKKLTAIAAVMMLLMAFKPEGAGYKIGDAAANFNLKNVNGKMISLSSFPDAKGFIVVFTCNHCPFAKKYEDRIIALDKKYKQLGYPVIAINPNDPTAHTEDSYANMQQRAKEKKFTFPYLVDETQVTALAYGATKTPHTFVLQKEASQYTVKYIGAIDDNTDEPKNVKEKYVENAVDNLLAGKPVNPETTKAIGCTIKWKS